LPSAIEGNIFLDPTDEEIFEERVEEEVLEESSKTKADKEE